MTRYVALLRGINVGTAKSIAMPDLSACFEGLGFTNVRTVLRSGNVVFDVRAAVDHGAPDHGVPDHGVPEHGVLERAIEAATGVSAGVVVVDERRFREIVAQNPLAEISTDPSRALVYFLDAVPLDAVPDDTSHRRPTDDELLPERLAFGPHAIYQWCPNGISKSKVPPKFFTGLGTTATGRNLRTVEKLVALLDAP